MRGGPFIALSVLVLYLAFASPRFLGFGNLMNVLRQVAINAILAVGQTVVILSAGIDLSVGAILALSASVGAVAMAYWEWNVWLSMLVALLVGVICGMVNGIVIAKGRIPDFIATIGMMSAARGLALIVTDGLPVPSHLTALTLRAGLPSELIWLGSGVVLGVPVPAIVAALMVVFGWFILRYTSFGRALYAVGGNREAARVSGISVERTKILVYTFSGLMAGIAGLVLTGRLNSANALMAEGAELQSIAAVVIGGTNLFGGEGGVGGTIIGVLIMGVLNNGLNLMNVSAFWQRVIMGAIIVGVVVFDQWRRRRFGD
ncbi:MAG: ABC transporter permease [Firmicutes bacterium]|nr:ABC transporter permease [Bacillota bacterium]